MYRGACWATVHGLAKELNMTETWQLNNRVNLVLVLLIIGCLYFWILKEFSKRSPIYNYIKPTISQMFKKWISQNSHQKE